MEVNSQRNGEQWRNGGSYRFVMCRTWRGWSVWTLGVAKIWRITAFKQRVGNFQKALQGLRMLCAAHCSAAWPGQLLFPYLWLCSAALPLWGHGGAAGKHEWKNKGGFFSFQMVWSCSVIMQTMCGIWASLGVGYKELKGLGQFFFPFQNEFRCRWMHSYWATPVIMMKLTEDRVLSVFLLVVYIYVLFMSLFCSLSK